MASGRQRDLVITAFSALAPGARFGYGELSRPGGRRLRWVETDHGGPTALLAAGAGDTVLEWGPVLPALCADFRVVSYDRAGLGASDPAPRTTLEAQVEDLIALLDLHGPAVLVGHSWGGLLVQFAAAARPGKVAGLVLVDPTHEEVMAELPARLRLGSDLLLTWFVLLKAMGMFEKRLAAFGRGTAEKCSADPAMQALFMEAYRASYTRFGQVASIRSENRLASGVTAARRARAAMTAPDVPMTILTGTRGKPPALQARAAVLADQTAAAFPRGQHVVVDDAGHYVHHDQPGAAAAAIKATAG